MSTVNALYHVVISTKNRKMTITENHKRELYKYIYSIIEANNCQLLRMNGIADHIHFLIQLHPSVALSNLIRDIKRASSMWLKENPAFPKFNGWAKEYAAFTCANKDKEVIINYIKGQEEHHKGLSFLDEIKAVAIKNGCVYYDQEE